MNISKSVVSILLIIILCFSWSCHHDTENNNQQMVGQSPLAPRQGITASTPPNIVVNIPALVGLTIEQIEARLGKPISKAQTNAIGNDSARSYRIGKYELMADYFVEKRIVDTFFFTTITGKGTSYNQLLAAGGLRTSDLNYRVEPFDQADSKRRLGILINVVTADTTAGTE